MTEILSKQSSNILLAKEENLLNWNEVLKMSKKTFGNDVYESWIKNINLKIQPENFFYNTTNEVLKQSKKKIRTYHSI